MRYEPFVFAVLAVGLYFAGSDRVVGYLPFWAAQPLATLHNEINSVARGELGQRPPQFKTIASSTPRPAPQPDSVGTASGSAPSDFGPGRDNAPGVSAPPVPDIGDGGTRGSATAMNRPSDARTLTSAEDVKAPPAATPVKGGGKGIDFGAR